MRSFLSLEPRSITLDSKAVKFRGGFRVPSERTIDCLSGRLLALFERIRRKLHLQSRATAHKHDIQTIPLMSQRAYENRLLVSTSPLFGTDKSMLEFERLQYARFLIAQSAARKRSSDRRRKQSTPSRSGHSGSVHLLNITNCDTVKLFRP